MAETTDTVSGNNPVYNTYETYEMYEIDNTAVCELLNSILQETIRKNEILENISGNLNEVKETIQLETLSAVDPEADQEESVELESYQETVVDLLAKMDESLISLSEASEGISDTVSGNYVYLDDINNTATTLLESYTETSAQQYQNEIYGLALGISIVFIISCIIGLLISRDVWGRTR